MNYLKKLGSLGIVILTILILIITNTEILAQKVILPNYKKGHKKNLVRLSQPDTGTYKKLSIKTDYNLKAVNFYDNRYGMIAGDKGTIFKTENGGIRWINISYGKNNLRGIWIIDPGKIAVAVGEGGIILRTTNWGKTWIRVGKGLTSNNLNAVSFDLKTNEGIAVGDKGTILYSKNGGKNWSNISNASTANNLNAAYCSYSKEYKKMITYVTGDGGTIMKTTDDLKNAKWNMDTTKISVLINLRGISFPNDSIGYIVGDAGTILTTTDFGKSWSYAQYGSKYRNLRGVHFPIRHIGFAVGDSGTVIRYFKGVWSVLNAPTSKTLFAVDPAAWNPAAVCVGENGEILRINPPSCDPLQYQVSGFNCDIYDCNYWSVRFTRVLPEKPNNDPPFTALRMCYTGLIYGPDTEVPYCIDCPNVGGWVTGEHTVSHSLTLDPGPNGFVLNASYFISMNLRISSTNSEYISFYMLDINGAPYHICSYNLTCSSSEGY